jgi:hypothetical protein
MNKAESDRVHELCSLIEKEQDEGKFLALVRELNQILNAKEARLRSAQNQRDDRREGEAQDKYKNDKDN